MAERDDMPVAPHRPVERALDVEAFGQADQRAVPARNEDGDVGGIGAERVDDVLQFQRLFELGQIGCLLYTSRCV